MRKVSILFAIVISISIFVSCFSTEHYLIKDFNFFGVVWTNPDEKTDEHKRFENVVDTLRDELYFRIHTYGEYQYGQLNHLSIVEKCYATTVPKRLDNKILLEDMEFRLDSDIYFLDDVIEKGTDLWNHPKLKEYRWYHETSHLGELPYNAFFGFNQNIYDKIHIPQRKYNIELTCKTTDGQKISKSIELYLKLRFIENN